MNELMRITIRRNSTSQWTAILIAMAIVCGVVLGVNLFVPGKSPLMFLNPYMVVFGIIFTVFAILINSSGAQTLVVHQHPDKTVRIEVTPKSGTGITIDRPMKLEAFACDHYIPRAGNTHILYLKIFDSTGVVALILKLQLGTMQDVPLGFYPATNSMVGPGKTYTCAKIAALHQELIKWVHKD